MPFGEIETLLRIRVVLDAELPLALASALRKLEQGVARAPLAPTTQVVNASHMMIANPFRARDVSRFLSTHPPMAERIARLEQMAYGHRITP